MQRVAFPWVAFAALLVGGVAIGFAGIFVRLSDLNPLASAFWRMALAAPLLWIWAWRIKPADVAAGKQLGFAPVLFFAGFTFAGDMGFWNLSLGHTTVANATLLSNAAPIFIALWSWLVLRHRFGPLFLLGLVTALFGAFLLVDAPVPTPGVKLTGDLLGLVSGVFYAAYQLVIKDARGAYSTARLMAWSTTLTGVVLLPFALGMEGRFLPGSAEAWLPLIALALFAQIGGQTVIAYAMAHLPASLASVSLLIQPLTAALAAWALFGEAMSFGQFVGGVLLLAGIGLARRGS